MQVTRTDSIQVRCQSRQEEVCAGGNHGAGVLPACTKGNKMREAYAMC